MTSPTVAAEKCSAAGAAHGPMETYSGRDTALGALRILRALPIKGKRLVGPWCFLDRYGPLTFREGKPMDVAPHPHIGLQTVTWLLEGEVVHNDSLGSEGLLRPGGVNVMTSGDGISHAEETPRVNSGVLNGVQLWTALPDARRKGSASFESVARVPVSEVPGGLAHVFAGALNGVTSPARFFSEIVGAEVQVHRNSTLELPLNTAHEHALLLLSGDTACEGEPLDLRNLYYLSHARSHLCLTSRDGARLLLIGGVPFPETILMWWNFVARTPEEIAAAREAWMRHERFGEVRAYRGPRLDAPALMHLARPNPAS